MENLVAEIISMVQEDIQEKIEIPEKFKKLVEQIENLSVIELAEFVKVLEKRFGVSAVAPVVGVAAGGASSLAESVAEKEEKTVFTIVLTAVGEKKIDVIKVVRDITGKGLKEAKDLVDAAATSPQIIRENVKKEEAEEMKKKLESAGSKVELR